jgi:hypothetical protein
VVREKRSQFAKNNQVPGLCKVRRWSTFPFTSKGRPDDGAGETGNRQEGRLESRETGRKAKAGRKGNRTEGRAERKGNRTEGSTRGQRETGGDGGRQNGRGSFGIVERNDDWQVARLAKLLGNGEAVFGSHSRWLRPTAKLERSPVPGRTTNGREPREG